MNVDGTIATYWLRPVHRLGTHSHDLGSLRIFTLLLPDTPLHHGIGLLLVFPLLPLQTRQCSPVSIQLNVTDLWNEHNNYMPNTHLPHFLTSLMGISQLDPKDCKSFVWLDAIPSRQRGSYNIYVVPTLSCFHMLCPKTPSL